MAQRPTLVFVVGNVLLQWNARLELPGLIEAIGRNWEVRAV